MAVERYQDYVIKDGKLIGKFEDAYKEFDDPFGQTRKEVFEPTKALVLNACERIRSETKANRIIELGCGFGDLAARLHAANFEAHGADISATAIAKAGQRHPGPAFHVNGFMETALYDRINPDIFIMSELSWYVLPQLKAFLEYLKENHRSKYLIHTICLYEKDDQKYGAEYFTTLEGILKYYALDYDEWAESKTKHSGHRTFFVAQI